MSFLQPIKSRIQLSSTKKAIAINVFWAVLGKIVTLLSGLLVGIFVARYLGPKQYGLMNYVISYVCLFQTFALFGMDAIEIREESTPRLPVPTMIGTAFIVKTLLGILFMALVLVTAWQMEADRYTILLIAIYSFSILLNSFSVIRNYFTAIVQNEFVVKAEIFSTCLCIAIKVLLLIVKAPLTWFVITSTVDFVLIAIGYYIAYRTKVGKIKDWGYDFEYAKFLIKESFPLMLTSAAVIVYQKIDQVMIGQMINKESVGFFSVASRFVEILIYIPMILAHTITPVLVKIRDKSEAEYLAKGQQFMNTSIWCSFVIAAVVSLLSYWIIRLTFGSEYMPAVAVLQIMAFKTVSVALSNTAGSMLVIEGLQKYAIFRDALGCIACIGLNYIFLPRYGIVAAAVIAIVSNVVAGYIADAVIPAYRHLFVHQTHALFWGWKELGSIKAIITSRSQATHSL